MDLIDGSQHVESKSTGEPGILYVPERTVTDHTKNKVRRC